MFGLSVGCAVPHTGKQNARIVTAVPGKMRASLGNDPMQPLPLLAGLRNWQPASCDYDLLAGRVCALQFGHGAGWPEVGSRISVAVLGVPLRFNMLVSGPAMES